MIDEENEEEDQSCVGHEQQLDMELTDQSFVWANPSWSSIMAWLEEFWIRGRGTPPACMLSDKSLSYFTLTFNFDGVVWNTELSCMPCWVVDCGMSTCLRIIVFDDDLNVDFNCCAAEIECGEVCVKWCCFDTVRVSRLIVLQVDEAVCSTCDSQKDAGFSVVRILGEVVGSRVVGPKVVDSCCFAVRSFV